MHQFIYLIVGKSGSGKSTIVEEYCNRYGGRSIASYTTRPPRFPNEQGHIFVDREHFPLKGDWVAYTEIEGYQYCATTQQVNESDFYVIDPAGIDFFTKAYRGPKIPIIIGIHTTDATRKERMASRGDSPKAIDSRISADSKVFENLRAHFWIENINLDAAVAGVHEVTTLVDATLRNIDTNPHETVHGLPPTRPYPKTVFIAGKVSDCPNYKANFEYVANSLRALDIVAVHPGLLPEFGFSYEQYMEMNAVMLKQCDAVMFLHNTYNSSGAKREINLAEYYNKPICFMRTFDDVYTRSNLFM